MESSTKKRKATGKLPPAPRRTGAARKRLSATARKTLKAVPKRPVGRPTKYCAEILELTRRYLDGHKSLGDPVPTIGGLCLVLDLDYDTIARWRNDPEKEEFSGLVEELMLRQERTLVSGGLRGEFNSSIVRLMLRRHGYIPAIAQEISGNPQGPPVTVVGVNGGTMTVDEAARLYFESIRGIR